MRRYLENLLPEQTGWLAGLRDRFVGCALGLLHERPSHHWTIDELGDAIGLSRSALHERFAEVVGQPSMQYLAQWRMQVAWRLLLESKLNVARMLSMFTAIARGLLSAVESMATPCSVKATRVVA